MSLRAHETTLYRADGLRTMGITSSVSATMSSPKVVLMTFCRGVAFCSTYAPNAYFFAWRFADIDVAPFGLVLRNR